jgi:hypothetical protein
MMRDMRGLTKKKKKKKILYNNLAFSEGEKKESFLSKKKITGADIRSSHTLYLFWVIIETFVNKFSSRSLISIQVRVNKEEQKTA